jgi:pilus assembly protein FimV
VPSAAPSATAAATNAELQGRVQQLETELAEARRLLEVRSAELATLQGAAAPPAPDVAAEPVVPETTVSPIPDAAPAEAQAVAEPKPAPEPEAAPPKKPRRKAAPPPVEEPSLFDRLSSFWYVPLGLLAAALGAAFWRRRRRVTEPSEDRLEEALARPTPDDQRGRPFGVGRQGESDIVVEERHPTEPSAATEPARRPTTVADTLSGDGPVSIEAGDPLAEADFHMAYGLYDQAADLVQLALKREPQRRELRLKLVEIFFVWGNRERFLESARQLHSTRAQAEPAEWDKVLIMGRQIAPDDPLFSEKTLSPSAHLDLELHGGAATTDFELSEVSATPLDMELTALAPHVRGDDSVDFLLDEPQRGGDAAAALAPTVETPRVPFPVDDPTAEVAIEELGLEPGDLARLDDTLSDRRPPAVEDTVEQPRAERGLLVEDTVQEDMGERRSAFEDTIEQPRAERGLLFEDTLKEDMAERRSAFEETVQQPIVRRGQDEAPEPDLLSATSMLRVDLEELGREALAADASAGSGTEVIDLSGHTGELPGFEASDLDVTGELERMDLKDEGDITMSEVGTKLDLARAYIDMGDPEGARSILEEVLKEGSAGHKLEAERLMAGLP